MAKNDFLRVKKLGKYLKKEKKRLILILLILIVLLLNPILLVPTSKLKIDLGLGLQNFTLFLMEKEMDMDYLVDLIFQKLIPKIDLFYLLVWLHS